MQPNDATGTRFYVFDPSGNTAQRLDSSQNTLSADLYDGFGGRLTGTASPDVYGYGAQWGYYTDTEMGLVLLTHRTYDPVAGRFLTRDPIGFAGGINLYAFVTNNPVNWIDPSGYDAATDIWRGGTLGATIGSGAGPEGTVIGGLVGAGTVAATLGVCWVIDKAWDHYKQASGDKSRAEYDKHKAATDAARERIRQLRDALRRAKGHKERKALEEDLKEEEAKLGGHEKEMGQKWPNGRP